MTHHSLRRQDRAISEDNAMKVIRAAHFAVLSTVGEDGLPYGVPVNAALSDGVLYVHGTKAEESRKAANLASHPAVSLCFTAFEKRVAADYSTDYASAIVEGTAAVVTDPAEKEKALLAICAQHALEAETAATLDYIRKGAAYAKVWRITIDRVTGKSRNWPAASAHLEGNLS